MKEQYYKDLKERQKKHLESISQINQIEWQPCLHEQCGQCHGTGVTILGPCIHSISCGCPKCSPR